MIRLGDKWAAKLIAEPETGMGYQIATVRLRDGRQFDQVVIIDGQITQIKGRRDLPFAEDDISEIVVTHEKWDFGLSGDQDPD